MEGLTLTEMHPHLARTATYHTYDDCCVSPQLPTPEASRSSHDGQSPLRIAPSVAATLTPLSSESYRSSAGSRRQSPGRSTPLSPPYRQIDAQRPSLPPLKTVLGGSTSSPPSTPSPSDNPNQLAPREPSYTTSTYKPPALYPNKKLKTEPPSFTNPQWQPLGGPLPAPTTTPPVPPMSASSIEHPKPAPSPVANAYDFNPVLDRRTSLPSHSRLLPPASELYNRADAPNDLPPASIPQSAHAPFPHSTAHVAPHSYPFRDHQPNAPAGGASHDSRTHSHDLTRRPSSLDHPRRELETHPLPPPVNYSQPPDFTDMRQAMYMRPLDGSSAHYAPGMCSLSAASGGPFFMPNPYDAHHAKARKRSNLPKNSTEIMRAWFDQNISNPYPSEEQKAMFSNATGISMTQVSNWFINHRRRCPELRDKREKSRPEGPSDNESENTGLRGQLGSS